jgi:sugar phosphate permease
MHPDMLSDPTIRLGFMQEKANYIHPLLYTFFVYLVIYFIRAVIAFAMKFFKKD